MTWLRRFRAWVYDNGLVHYCHRCDRFLKPWARCAHNGRWSPVKWDR